MKAIIGYSITFKKNEDAKSFHESLPNSIYHKMYSENEVLIAEVEKIQKDDISYLFKFEGGRIEVEVRKISFVETLYER